MSRFAALWHLGAMWLLFGTSLPVATASSTVGSHFSSDQLGWNNRTGLLKAVNGIRRQEASSPAPEDEFWVDEFGLPAIDGVVKCAAIWNGSLIIGGQFYQVGGVAATNIALWDGFAWNPLGNGTDEQVLSLIVYDGELIAGGSFTRAGDVDAPGVARWNGSEWNGLGPGLWSSQYDMPHVLSLAIYRGLLVAAGGFTYSGSTSLSRVAGWDGFAWSSLGAGLNGPGFALAVLGDSLFVGGSFDHAGSEPVSCLAKWDGDVWTNVGGGVTVGATPGAVWAFAVHQNRLFVGGEFDSVGTIAARNIASWGDGAWSALAEGIPARVTCLASFQSSLAAGLYFGSQGVYLWDGSSWTRTAPMEYGYALTLLPTGSDLIVGGAFRANAVPQGTVAGFNLARWTGETWVGYETWNDRMHGLSTLFGGSPHVQSICVHDGEIVAGGAIDLAGDPPTWAPTGTVTSWDGRRWHGLLPETFSGQAYALTSENDTLYAGGSFYTPFPFYPPNSAVLRYADGVWSSMGAVLNTGTSITRFQGTMYLGTARGSSNSPEEAGLYRWDGTNWQLIGSAESSTPFYGVRSMAIHDGKLVVGGSFERIGELSAVNIATWDGTRWDSFGSGLGSDWFGVGGLTDWNGKLVAVGSFPNLPGGQNGAAFWSGTSWEGLGQLDGIPYTVGSVGGRLFAGGWFGSVRQHLEGLLQFDGAVWDRVGSGVNGPVNAITEWNNTLVIGGSFTRAGGLSSFGVAIWDGVATTPPAAPRVALLSANRPNPFRTETHFSLDLPSPAKIRVSIHDASGREIALVANAIQTNGTTDLVWNGRDAGGRRVPTGIYFVRAALPDRKVLARKVMLIR